MNKQQEKETNTDNSPTSSSYIFTNKYERNRYNIDFSNLHNYRDDESTTITNRNNIQDSSPMPNILEQMMLTDQQYKQYNLNRLNASTNDQNPYNDKDNNEIGVKDNVKRSNQNFINKSLDTQYVICKRKNAYTHTNHRFCNDAVTTTTKHEIKCSQFASMIDARYCAEKATFVRPLVNYNHELIYKTIEKNQRLQNIVQQLSMARQKERKCNAWQKFINELKHKHGYKEVRDITAQQINDFFKTNYDGKQSSSCKILLNDIYQQNDEAKFDGDYYNPDHDYEDSARFYDCSSQCYPMSSQGRSIILNRERLKQPLYINRHYRPLSRNIYGSTIIVGKEPNKKREHIHLSPGKELLRSSSIQTNYTLLSPTKHDVGINYEVEESDTSKEKIKTISEKKKYEHRRKSISHIESKIDALINSVNTLIIQIKANMVGDRNIRLKTVSHKSSSFSDQLNTTRSDTCEMQKYRKKLGCMVTDNPQNSYIISKSNNVARNYSKEGVTNMETIIIEEVDKSRKVKSYLENILTAHLKNPYTVEVIDIPTKEQSTQGADPVSVTINANRNKNNEIKEMSTILSRMTTAVNTDPLGILALLRVSTETLKHLISYMPNIPNIPYYSYLSILQRPRLQINKISHYICNICGAAFRKPSQLTDHINGHNLGKARDCCVCRHYLDSQSQSSRPLFACRHCGQRFTRAYCCDLHEQSCAKRLGRRHDVDSSHIILK